MDYLVFMDCETTGLDERVHRPWEVAARVFAVWDGRMTMHGSFLGLIDLTADEISGAEPKALEIGGFAKRWKSDDAHRPGVVAGCLKDLIPTGARLCGSNPDFDARFIGPLFDAVGLKRPWHYRTIDVPTLAAGWLASQVQGYLLARESARLAAGTMSSYDLARLLGVEPYNYATHTAMGDVDWTVALYAAVHGLTVS